MHGDVSGWPRPVGCAATCLGRLMLQPATGPARLSFSGAGSGAGRMRTCSMPSLLQLLTWWLHCAGWVAAAGSLIPLCCTSPPPRVRDSRHSVSVVSFFPKYVTSNKATGECDACPLTSCSAVDSLAHSTGWDSWLPPLLCFPSFGFPVSGLCCRAGTVRCSYGKAEELLLLNWIV